jgi:hypothetical protein
MAILFGALALATGCYGDPDGAGEPIVIIGHELSGPTSIVVNTCSEPFVITMMLNGSPSSLGSDSAYILEGGGSGKFYSDDACTEEIAYVTLSGSEQTVSFYFKDTVVENLTISATLPNDVKSSVSTEITAGP